MSAPYVLIHAGHSTEFDDLETFLDAIHGTIDEEAEDDGDTYVVELKRVPAGEARG